MSVGFGAVRRPGVPWVPVLGLFSLWLVLQNAVLFTIVLTGHPGLVSSLAALAARATARLLIAGHRVLAGLAADASGSPIGILDVLRGGVL